MVAGVGGPGGIIPVHIFRGGRARLCQDRTVRWVRVFLGCTEILAALLFLVPRTLVTGGYSLAAVFILAIVVHLLHGWFDIGGLLVYTAAALAVTAYKADRQKREVRYDR